MKRVVLITGAVGGIGRASCRVFHQQGWHVIGVDKYQPQEEIDGVSRFIHADISDPQVPESLFQSVAEQESCLHALVNNAAVQLCKPFVETSAEEWDYVMDSNLRSIFLSVKYAFDLLKANRGAVVNVGSVHAIATSKNIAAYATSKGALLALTRALALEFGEVGVRVNTVLPGAIDTPMLHAGLSRGHLEGENITELVRGLGHKHVMGRVGQPEEIGQAIWFLANNDHSSFMTGQALVVDGGATARLSTE